MRLRLPLALLAALDLAACMSAVVVSVLNGATPLKVTSLLLTLTFLSWLGAGHFTGLYGQGKSLSRRDIPQLALLMCCLTLLPPAATILAWGAASGAPRLQIIPWAVGACGFIVLTHVIWQHCMTALLKRGYCLRRAMVFGGTTYADGRSTDIGRPCIRCTVSRFKRVFDLAAALCALVVLSPGLLLIALAIRLDSPGPALFRQTREGIAGSTFLILKFRTMLHRPPHIERPTQTCRDDIRVTRLGKLLRKTSLDELPQLFNVLVGSMSIIGPRPHAVGMVVAGLPPGAILADYQSRYTVKPGITGWAQVNGSRGELVSARDLRRRLALDRHYIENWSLPLDLKIMLRTSALPFVDSHAF